MSVSSLSRFTVPLSGASSQGTLMPKLKYRFRCFLENFGVTSPSSELTKNVVSIARPNVQFGDQTIHVYNSRIKLAGKPDWQPIEIVLRDDVNGEVSRRVGEQVQKQFDFYEQASAAAGIDYKFTTRYEVLDGGNGAFEPTVLESWEIYGCIIQSVNYGDMAYESDEPVTISLSLAFDNALQVPLGDGVGTNVGRAGGTVATG